MGADKKDQTPDVDLAALRATAQAGSGRQFWRSLDELAGTPAFAKSLQNEFPYPPGATPSTFNRREILKVMAASAALAGLTGCTKMPTQHIVPYVRQPEDIIAGEALFLRHR